MGSPSAVLTMGLGSWGSVNEMITLGYGSGAAAVSFGHNVTIAATDRSSITIAATDASSITIPVDVT